jgi:nucleoside-diphosphate-sugar epimerase
MKVLFIGGTGIISSACAELALESGIELYLYNRGNQKSLFKNAHLITGDIRDYNLSYKLLGDMNFDVIVQFVAYNPEHVKQDIKLFSGKTAQYIFISSAAVYEKPPTRLPITELTPVKNQFWEYARNKIECEKILLKEAYENYFPVTIVRPSHTYNKTKFPVIGHYTTINRIKQNKPIVIHGDGTSLWTLTHSRDFAKGLTGLFGNYKSLGEIFHITSDEWLSWNNIYSIIASHLNVELKIIHIPSEIIALYDSELGANLLGDKAHSMIFDNSKIKRIVPSFKASIPFDEGCKEIIEWHNNPENQIIDSALDKLFDKMIRDIEKIKS